MSLDRTSRLLLAAGIAFGIAGLVVLLAGEGGAVFVGYGLFGVSAVLLISLGFYVVGLSEDRERRRRQ